MYAFGLGFLITAIIAPFVMQMLTQMKSRQTVSQFAPAGHQMKQGTPTMGGIMIVLGFLAPAIAFHLQWGFILLWVGMALIGFLDDYWVPKLFPGKRGLGWKQKLVLELVVCILAGLMIHIGSSIWAFCFIVLFGCNAYNFADGLDWLAASIGILLLPGLAYLSSTVGMTPYVDASLGLVGAFIPFAYLNKPKAKVFMGDVGSLPIGALIGAISFSLVLIRFGGFAPLMRPAVGVLWTVLVIELIPVPMQIFWVKVFKKRLFPFTPIHHAFEKAGWPEARVVMMFAGVQLAATLLAVGLASGKL